MTLLSHTVILILNYIFILAVIIFLVKFVLINFRYNRPKKSLLVVILGLVCVLFISESFLTSHYAILIFQKEGNWVYSLKDAFLPDIYSLVLCILIYFITKRADKEIKKEIEENQKDEYHQKWKTFTKKNKNIDDEIDNKAGE